MGEGTEILKKSLVDRIHALSALVNARHVSLWIYFGIAVFGELNDRLNTENAKSLFSPMVLYVATACCATAWKGLLALKMVMSTAWTNNKPPEPPKGAP